MQTTRGRRRSLQTFALAVGKGHATLQAPMEIYHANLKGFQTQVSPRKLCSFSTKKADSRQEQTVEMSMAEIRRR